MGRGAGALHDDQVGIAADHDDLVAGADGGEAIAGQLGPGAALVVAPEAEAVAPPCFGLGGFDHVGDDGGFAEPGGGDDLLAVPDAVVEPEKAEPGHIAGGALQDRGVAEDALASDIGHGEVLVTPGPGSANGVANPTVEKAADAGSGLGVGGLVGVVGGGDGVGEDVHAEGLVVELLAGGFAGLHVAGGVADELAEGDGGVFGEGVAARLGSEAFGDVHQLGGIVDDRVVGRADAAVGDGYGEGGGERGFPGGGLVLTLIDRDALVPFGGDSAVADDEEAVGVVAGDPGLPPADSGELVRIKA